ncbi:MAG TPA: hypothetical protein PLL33_15570, partial [Paracoccus sp. (in: a-proteobacteria)]|nr:hypothetical protein [Paracoccus sp. (in: a-proteobacteria)]
MNSQFATAMSRALDQTRAGNTAEATRIIQAALAGDTLPPSGTAAPEGNKPPRPARSLPGRPPAARIEDAEVVEVHPPRRPAPAFAARPAMPGLQAGPQPGPAELRRMLDKLGCMAP